VRDESKPGTGITVSTPLAAAHTVGAITRGGGTGITLTSPVTKAHANNTAIGKAGMSLTESRTHFSLWAMAAAPLLAGTDVVNIAKENLAIYLNQDIIAVDQDPLGDHAETVSNLNGQWKLKRRLANGDKAVALFNANTTDWLAASADLASVGLDASTAYLAKDLWTKQTSNVTDAVSISSIPAHATAIYRLSTRPPAVTVPSGVAAKSPGANGTTVTYDASAVDAFGGTGLQRPGDDHLQAAHLRHPTAPHGRLLQDAHLHPVHHDPIAEARVKGPGPFTRPYFRAEARNPHR